MSKGNILMFKGTPPVVRVVLAEIFIEMAFDLFRKLGFRSNLHSLLIEMAIRLCYMIFQWQICLFLKDSQIVSILRDLIFTNFEILHLFLGQLNQSSPRYPHSGGVIQSIIHFNLYFFLFFIKTWSGNSPLLKKKSGSTVVYFFRFNICGEPCKRKLSTEGNLKQMLSLYNNPI